MRDPSTIEADIAVRVSAGQLLVAFRHRFPALAPILNGLAERISASIDALIAEHGRAMAREREDNAIVDAAIREGRVAYVSSAVN